jgi:RNA polymerase sigma-70 factor (ECF subfamily)
MESDDIVQEVLIGLWLKRENLPQIIYPYHYLIAAVNHMAYNYFRHIGIVRKYEKNTIITNVDDTLEAATDVKLIESEINVGINKLPARCRTAYYLSRQRHMSIAEISEHMKISRRTVENYITTALKHIRLMLDSHVNNVTTGPMDGSLIFMMPPESDPDEVTTLLLRHAS